MRVYDWIKVSRDAPSFRDLGAFPRVVTVRFNLPGDATVRLRGRGVGGVETTVEQHIQILP